MRRVVDWTLVGGGEVQWLISSVGDFEEDAHAVSEGEVDAGVWGQEMFDEFDGLPVVA